MTVVVIVPETGKRGAVRYRATSRLAQSTGATAGAALNALLRQIPHDDTEASVRIALDAEGRDEVLTSAAAVYAGLLPSEVTEVERVALDRSRWRGR